MAICSWASSIDLMLEKLTCDAQNRMMEFSYLQKTFKLWIILGLLRKESIIETMQLILFKD